MLYTLIFIVFFQSGSSVLTQSGFKSMEDCNKAGDVMVERFQFYDQGRSRIEWVCK